MKWIKLFEGFDEGVYTKIDTLFSRETILPIDKYIKPLDRLLSKYYSYKYEKRSSLGGPVLQYVSKVSSMAPSIDIRLYDDDWFSVGLWYRDTNGQMNGNAQYYKCDQLYGVEKLLKDKHII